MLQQRSDEAITLHHVGRDESARLARVAHHLVRGGESLDSRSRAAGVDQVDDVYVNSASFLIGDGVGLVVCLCV